MDIRPFEAPKSFGSFELLEKVGRGSAATVYKGRRKGTGQIVALKIGRRALALDPDNFERFRREFTVVGQLWHANLVATLEFGEHNHIPYLVLEYVAGSSLEARLKKLGPLGMQEAIAVICQVADAVSYLHQHHILHRDIKPGNILINSDGNAKLGDFGLLKKLTDGVTLTLDNQSMGTMEYGAPEQFEDAKNTDVRCDVYALAATFYTALTGQSPFGSGGNLRILQRKLLDQFLPLRMALPKIPRVLDQLISRSLSARVDQRPADINEFCAGLRQVSDVVSPFATVSAADGGSKSAERRARSRVAISFPAACVPFHEAKRGSWDATVMDVSPGGLRLQTAQLLPVDAILELTLSKPPGLHLVRVRWVQPADGGYCVGCSFVRPLPDGTFEEMCGT